jgi:hypothetical protein
MARLEITDEILARFLAKVDTSGQCWTWTGGTNGRGYGQFHHRRSDGKRQRYAHRVMYELYVGPIPEGMTLDHTCERGSDRCVTPTHLRVLSMTENVMVSSRNILAQKARQTHCIHGHELAGDNLVIQPNGRRGCRTCHSTATSPWPSQTKERKAAYQREMWANMAPEERRRRYDRDNQRRQRRRQAT